MKYHYDFIKIIMNSLTFYKKRNMKATQARLLCCGSLMSRLKNSTFLIFVALTIVGCGPRGPLVEIKREAGQFQLMVNRHLVHESKRAITEAEAFSDLNQTVVAARWRENGSSKGKEFFAFQVDEAWREPQEADYQLKLRTQTLTPSEESQAIQPKETNTFIVQMKTEAIPAYRDAIEALGAEVIGYIAHYAYIVRLNAADVSALDELTFVRAMIPLKGEFKIARRVAAYCNSSTQARSFALTAHRSTDLPRLRTAIVQKFGAVPMDSSFMTIEAQLPCALVYELAGLDEVQWVDLGAGEIEEDTNAVRIMGGADYLQNLPTNAPSTYTGIGLRGHVLEGINPDHEDFAANEFREKPIAVDDSRSSPHGQATFGIIFGSGKGNPNAKGLLPHAQGLFTNYSVIKKGDPSRKVKGTRYELVKRLIDEYSVMFQTASWGYEVTEDYTSRSLEMDAIIFDLDLPITQSAGNTGTREMRPQAWAKNIISVGAVHHLNTVDFADDKWADGDQGRGSVGPAKDGRIKPDLVANYDGTLTTSIEGYTVFTGTSAATPVVAGYMGLALEMWTNGDFSNPLAYPVAERFSNRPHASTVKALLINGATQYPFNDPEADLRRAHQGWGFPNVASLFNDRHAIEVIDETVILKPLDTHSQFVEVGEGRPMLAITMVYADPPGKLVSAKAQVNDLDLKVTAPDGTVYWGNWGLKDGNFSQGNGFPDTVDTVENVFINNPQAGTWQVEVIASGVREDAHKETSEVDADFSLVIRGIKKTIPSEE